MEEKVICSVCGEEEAKEEVLEVNGEFYCQDCFNDEFVFCKDCGKIIRRDEAIEFNEYCDEYLCQDCYDDKYVTCHDCGEVLREEDALWVEDLQYYICEDCRCDSDYAYCEDCGGLFDYDYEYDEDDDCCYCYECMNKHPKTIHSYHHSHDFSPIFFGREDVENGEQPLFEGVELEIDKGENASELAGEILNIMPNDFITAERDGSLNSGFENITQPATLAYHTSIADKYKEMFSLAIDNGFRSHDTCTCGLHIHINRSFFEDKEEESILKMLYLVEKFWDELAKFSRRDYSNLERWAKKYEDTPQEVLEKMKNYSLDRYHAINLTNRNTIEFRLFRGTLRFETFLATLQLVDTIARVCKNCSTLELQKMEFADLLVTEELRAYWETVKNRTVYGIVYL